MSTSSPIKRKFTFPLWGAAVLIWLEVVLLNAWKKWPLISQGLLPGNDDYMRLVQVRDWLGGQGFMDMSQYRLYPPDPLQSHWARLPDMILGGVMKLLTPIFGESGAETAALLIVPALLLLIALVLTAYIAKRVSDNPLMPFIAPVLLGLCFPVMYQFYPGRIDHHGLQVVLGLAALLTLLKAAERPIWAYPTGLFCGLALWVGIEAAPFVAAACIALSLNWVLKDNNAARALRGFAMSFAATVAACLILSRPASLWGAAQCDALSLVYLVAVGFVALAILGATRLASKARSAWTRLIALGGAGFGAIVATLTLFPQCLSGPYAALDPRLEEIWLSNVQEAYPFHIFIKADPVTASALLVVTLLAVIGLVLMAREKGVKALALQNAPVRAAAIFALLAFLTGLIQLRQMTFAGAFAAPLAAYVMAWGLVKSASIQPDLKRALARLGIIFACSPLALPGFVNAITPDRPPEIQTAQSAAPCMSKSALAALDGLGEGFALTQIDMGTPLLLSTKLSVSSAPYHRNIKGNLASIDAFTLPPQEARRFITAQGVDYLISCDPLNETRLIQRLAPDGLLSELMAGRVPLWLEPVALGDQQSADSPLRVYRLMR